MREAMIALEAGEVIAIFPQGGIVWPPEPGLKLKKGAIRLAQKTNSLLFPVSVSGLRFKGHVVFCFLLMAKARIEMHSSINCEPIAHNECVNQLAYILNQSSHLKT